jgi:hypothetical protein
VKTTLTTGMLMFGKMSVGVRRAAVVPKIRINSAMTTNVYGRRRASRTIPIIAVPSRNEFFRIVRRAPQAAWRRPRSNAPRSSGDGALCLVATQILGLSLPFGKCILLI